MSHFVLITHSANKVAEFERILGRRVEHHGLDLPEIQAVDVEQVVLAKVKTAFELLRRPVMVEDTGLYFDGLNGLPGALVKWFVERVGVDGMAAMLREGLSRVAWAETVIACYDGHSAPQMFVGKIEGQIAPQARGAGGFGWDALFIPAGAFQTFAEMEPAEKDRYSMRRRALEALAYGLAPSADQPQQV